MNIRCFHIGLAGLIFALVSTGFSESYPNRPTATEMDQNVAMGIQCIRGVNERCWATQYSTNPVQYHVEPLTNTAELYLDQSLAGTMASKIKSLAPRYADPDTIYDGTPNIAMLTVPGVWEELEIGDSENLFTEAPAMGGNPPTYGDYPWRIYVVNMQERHNVLNVMQCTAPIGGWWYPGGAGNYQEKTADRTETWEAAKTLADDLSWTPSCNSSPAYCYAGGGAYASDDWFADKHLAAVYGYVSAINTAISHSASFFFQAGTNFPGIFTAEFYDYGIGLYNGKFTHIESFGTSANSGFTSTVLIGTAPSQASWIAMPWCSPPSPGNGGAKGFSYGAKYWIVNWNFQY